MRRHAIVPVLLLALAAGCAAVADAPAPAPVPATSPAPAAASGLDTPLCPEGLVSPAGGAVFCVVPIAEGTRILAFDPASDLVRSAPAVPGRFVLPQVTVSGTLGGLSHDGGTLVLAEARPRQDGATRFAVLDADLDEQAGFLDLDGEFAFDALSPDGERLFLIEHLPPFGSARYQVRMLDVATGTLEPAPIVDKRFPDEQMRGLPLARAESADGFWVYTLYRDGARNFVHALQTDGAAFCIDLPAAASPGGAWALTATRDGRTLEVQNVADGAGAAIDLESFSVLEG